MRKVCLIIIDGFGVAPEGPGNARTLAKLPTIDRLAKEFPNCLMDASGHAVGVPVDQQGSSESGHMIIGAGRIVWQPLEEINREIASGAFFKNPVLTSAVDRSKEKGKNLHFIGMYSFGGVHSHAHHWHAMLKMAKERGVKRVFLHLFSDGRDVPEQHFCVDYDLLKAEISKQSIGTVASLIGRWFSMDRDLRYVTRTKPTYDLLTQGIGEEVKDLAEGVRAFYLVAPEKEKTDLYVRPMKTPDYEPIKADDVVISINFRKDRMIEIIQALADKDFDKFDRPVHVKDVVCMGPYSEHLPIAYPPRSAPHSLGEVVSKAGFKQLRLSETEKHAHITYFFNQQSWEPFPGEDHIHVRTPDVPNMADAPEMAAKEITENLLKAVKEEKYELIVVNYANPDVVGHGGRLDAVVEACEFVDKQLSIVLPVLEEHGYDWIVTADHGNAEEMYYPGTTNINPSHTTNPVQTFVHSSKYPDQKSLKGKTGLKDIAPMVLEIMGLPVPKEMQ
jgi:2,3-bisphosphoglycerate-independent phosphoglycerate mutase